MSTRNSKQVLKDLKNGILPAELDFSVKTAPEVIDWNMVRYNSFYKSSDFFESKFPNGMLQIPGFDKVIEIMAENAKSPLEEMENRQQAKENEIVHNILQMQENIKKYHEDELKYDKSERWCRHPMYIANRIAEGLGNEPSPK
jgi:uncharacterized membrane protein